MQHEREIAYNTKYNTLCVQSLDSFVSVQEEIQPMLAREKHICAHNYYFRVLFLQWSTTAAENDIPDC